MALLIGSRRRVSFSCVMSRAVARQASECLVEDVLGHSWSGQVQFMAERSHLVEDAAAVLVVAALVLMEILEGDPPVPADRAVGDLPG
jgi:hypothetical protein